jgi:TRAP-type C4-dicarboxylate transport system permease small subunit
MNYSISINDLFYTVLVLLCAIFFIVRAYQYRQFGMGKKETVPPPIGISQTNPQRSRKAALIASWVALSVACFCVLLIFYIFL